ncbi:MAG: hypothetical protein H6Q39_897 [Chloroflexi bacterium]|nr:hypothetical protein [Chloroflexota bacterium]
MTELGMKIAVCLKEVIDTGLNLGYGQVSEALLRKGQSSRLNPNDAQALAQAIKFKEVHSQTEITVVSLGPGRVETYLRDGLAAGADRAIRVWEEGLADLSPYQKSKVLSGALALAGSDLILVGARSLDNASGLVGPLMAAWLDMPCICETVAFALEKDQGMTVTRNFSKGMQERVLCRLPAVLAVAGGRENLPYASLEKIMEGQAARIICYSLADIGVSPGELKNDPTRISGVSFPRPRPKAAPYDASLPAFYRILALLEGGISRRRGEILKGDIDAVVNQLFELLIKEGVIKSSAK